MIVENFIHRTDSMFLEDETSRVRISGKFDFRKIITGQILAFIGIKKASVFEVQTVVFPGLAMQLNFHFKGNLENNQTKHDSVNLTSLIILAMNMLSGLDSLYEKQLN